MDRAETVALAKRVNSETEMMHHLLKSLRSAVALFEMQFDSAKVSDDLPKEKGVAINIFVSTPNPFEAVSGAVYQLSTITRRGALYRETPRVEMRSERWEIGFNIVIVEGAECDGLQSAGSARS